MPLVFKESARSLKTFFILSGVVGFAASLLELAMLASVAQQPGGLSTQGKVYQLLVVLSIAIAMFLFYSGVFFKLVATSVPYLVLYALGTAIVLRLVVIVMFPVPSTVAFGGFSVALCAYLLFQYRRVSEELRNAPNQST